MAICLHAKQVYSHRTWTNQAAPGARLLCVCFHEFGVLLGGVLVIRAVLLGVSIAALMFVISYVNMGNMQVGGALRAMRARLINGRDVCAPHQDHPTTLE